LELDAWSFFGIWSLGFGAFSLPSLGMTMIANNASVRSLMLTFADAFDFQQINSAVYFGAAAVLIFTAAVLAAKKVQPQLPAKSLVGIAGLTLLTLMLIWLLVSVLNRKEATPPSPPPDYSAPTGTP
jgi:NADH:ubiquinone oxidoreductase subunit 6 (subunit J)